MMRGLSVWCVWNLWTNIPRVHNTTLHSIVFLVIHSVYVLTTALWRRVAILQRDFCFYWFAAGDFFFWSD